ncbi:MAG TPA: hypothetical protein VH593_11540 [Ktedonobacteraceae bacterium]
MIQIGSETSGVGGSALVTAVLLLMNCKRQALIALASGAILIGWMVTEIGIIGVRFWWQPCFLGLGLIAFMLALILQTAKQVER